MTDFYRLNCQLLKVDFKLIYEFELALYRIFVSKTCWCFVFLFIHCLSLVGYGSYFELIEDGLAQKAGLDMSEKLSINSIIFFLGNYSLEAPRSYRQSLGTYIDS